MCENPISQAPTAALLMYPVSLEWNPANHSDLTYICAGSGTGNQGCGWPTRLTDRHGQSCNLPDGVFFTREAFAAMPTTAILEDLIDALEEQSDSSLAYLDRDTGEVFLISQESLSLGEAEPEEIASLPGWQKEEAEL